MSHCNLMVYIQIHHFGNKPFSLGFIAQPQVSQSHHQIAMDFVANIQIVIPYQQIRQRYREIVNLHVVKQMLFTVLDQLIETTSGLSLITQLSPGESLVENLVRLLVVIEESDGRVRPNRG